MILKMTYSFNGVSDSVEINCSNYTFGLPVLFGKFKEKHGECYQDLGERGMVTGIRIHSYYNDKWRELESAGISLGNKHIKIYDETSK